MRPTFHESHGSESWKAISQNWKLCAPSGVYRQVWARWALVMASLLSCWPMDSEGWSCWPTSNHPEMDGYWLTAKRWTGLCAS